MGASFSRFRCFVLEIWVLLFGVLGASCFGLRFRVPRFQNYRLKIGFNCRPPRVTKRHRAVFRLLPTLKTIYSTLRSSQRTADVFPVVASPVAVRYINNSPIFAKTITTSIAKHHRRPSIEESRCFGELIFALCFRFCPMKKSSN